MQEALAISPWRFWGHTFGLLLASVTWADEVERKELAPAVAASRARDVAERYQRALVWTGIALPEARKFTGERYLAAFAGLLARVCDEVAADSWAQKA